MCLALQPRFELIPYLLHALVSIITRAAAQSRQERGARCHAQFSSLIHPIENVSGTWERRLSVLEMR